MTIDFRELPTDILGVIHQFLDIPSACRLYIAYSQTEFSVELAAFLVENVVEVTPEEVIDGDLDKIDFYTYAKLTPCRIHVTIPVGLWKKTMWHLSQVEYILLSVTVDNNFELHSGRDIIPLINLKDLTSNVVALSVVGKIQFDPRDIPVSVTKLAIGECVFELLPNLEHLVNLTHYTSYELNHNGLVLPRLLTTLKTDAVLDLSPFTLPNLKHVNGYRIEGIPWSQIETASIRNFPHNESFNQLREITIGSGYVSFKNCDCPKLEKVKFSQTLGEIAGGDVSEFFTPSQLARLTSLIGRKLQVSDMSVLKQVQVLHIEWDERLTEWLYLPPNLVDFKVWLSHPVDGIPRQLKVFAYVAANASYRPDSHRYVNVKSTTLMSLLVTGADTVAIDCPTLTNLLLTWIRDKLIKPNIPNVVKLYVHSTQLPLEMVPRLNHLDMNQTNTDVVIKRRLRSVRLNVVHLSKVDIVADRVTLDDCAFVEVDITTKVLQLESYFLDLKSVNCQELICDYIQINEIPQMVEKLSFRRLNAITFDGDSRDYYINHLRNCHKLKSLVIDIAIFSGVGEHQPTIPATVTQLRLNTVLAFGTDSSHRRQFWNFEDVSKLEHVECWRGVTMEEFGIGRGQWPPSIYVPPQILIIQPHLLR